MPEALPNRALQPLETDEPLRDLGVLFVHGIGQSGRGETLLRFGEPLRACIEKLALPVNPNFAVKATVVSANLDVSPETPANAEVLIQGVSPQDKSKPPEQRWLLAEAWWAKKFPTPTFGEIASWSFEVLPWTLIAHFDRRFRRLGFRFCNALDSSRPLATLWIPFLLWVVEGLKLTFALAISPLLLVLVGLISLLGLIPYAKLRDFARAVQRKMAATVGDSFVFMHQQITGAAICASVRGDLEWLAARCRRVAVVAHSQGGAIAHKVLRGPVTAPCDVLVTFGSGLAKLSEMERAVFDKGRRFLWMPILGAFLTAAAFLARLGLAWHRDPQLWVLLDVLLQSFLVVELGMLLVLVDLVLVGEKDKLDEADRPPSRSAAVAFVAVAALLRALLGDDALPVWLGTGLAAVFAASLAFTYYSLRCWHIESRRSLNARAQWQIDRELYRNDFQLHNRGWMRWHDLYSSADPVPNGPLLDDFNPEDLYSLEVTNLHSFFSDHTRYWDNQDEFVKKVASVLLSTAQLKSATMGFYAGARRHWRGNWRAVAQWMITLCSLAVAFRWFTQAPLVLDKILNSQPVSRSATVLVQHQSALALLLAAVLWLVATAIVLTAWKIWDHHEMALAFSRADYRLPTPQFVFFLSALSVTIAFCLWEVPHTAALVTAGIVGVVLVVVLGQRRARNWLQLRSASGTLESLRQLRLEELRRSAEFALARPNVFELTRLGRALNFLDDDLAERVMQAAIDNGSANAALDLGYHYRRRGHADKAREAFRKGADLGDANCAYKFAASYESNDGKRLEAYRRAFQLGDVASAHSLGLALDTPAHSLGLALEDQVRETEVIEVYQEGARRGDALSAQFLASKLLQKSRQMEQSDSAEAGRQRTRALALYRRAFELGDVQSVSLAGDLRREEGNIPRARRNYRLGARLRHAESAYKLGLLEEEEQQDVAAAREAYELAIRLAESSDTVYRARFRLGRLFENEGRLQAAMHQYAAAVGEGGSLRGSGEAALRLATLMEKDKDYGKQSKAKAMFQRAVALNPQISAKAYVEFLSRHFDRTAANELYQKGTDRFSADALLELGKMLRFSDSAAARDLFTRALQAGSAPAAGELYRSLFDVGIDQAKQTVLDLVMERGFWFPEEVANLLEKDGQTALAQELRKRIAEKPSDHTQAVQP